MNPQREDTSHEAELITGQQLESFFVPRRLQRLQQLCASVCASVRRCNHKYHSFPALRNDKHLVLRTLFSFFRVLQKNGRNRLDLSARSTKRLQCLCVCVRLCVSGGLHNQRLVNRREEALVQPAQIPRQQLHFL